MSAGLRAAHCAGWAKVYWVCFLSVLSVWRALPGVGACAGGGAGPAEKGRWERCWLASQWFGHPLPPPIPCFHRAAHGGGRHAVLVVVSCLLPGPVAIQFRAVRSLGPGPVSGFVRAACAALATR